MKRAVLRAWSGLIAGRALVFDVLTVVIAIVLGLTMVTGHTPILKSYRGATAVVLVASALPLLYRRRAPLTVAWITVGTAAIVPLVETVAPGTLIRTATRVDLQGAVLCWAPAAPFAAYGAMAFTRNRVAAWLPAVALAALMLIATPVFPAFPLARPQETTDTALGYRSFMFVLVGALLGLYFAARRRALKALTERAERAERERYLLAEQARADERARLAAEMHDVVTHRVSLMVVQAGALRITAPDERTRSAAEDLRAAGCQALCELRDVVGLLRSDAREPAAVPAAEPLPDLTPLVDESRAAGTPVELIEEGSPALASPVVGRTAYRVVQEALTNVRKHAPGARVRVRVRYGTGGLRLSVTNTPPARPADPLLAAAGSGTGLAGLSQRVELVEGSLEAGPAPDGGFRVEAVLPAYVPTPEPAP